MYYWYYNYVRWRRYVTPAFVCPSVWLLPSLRTHYTERMFVKIVPDMYLCTRKKWLKFGSHPAADSHPRTTTVQYSSALRSTQFCTIWLISRERQIVFSCTKTNFMQCKSRLQQKLTLYKLCVFDIYKLWHQTLATVTGHGSVDARRRSFPTYANSAERNDLVFSSSCTLVLISTSQPRTTLVRVRTPWYPGTTCRGHDKIQ